MNPMGAASSLPPELINEAICWRQHLHKHPELAFNERQTGDFVASQLARAGLRVHRGLGVTGVVGTLTRGTSRRSIGIRADMDALPIQEHSGVAHTSQSPGIMHACGHDGHVAMALAAASAIARIPDLDGTVHFIFQPAEENEGGGRRMVEDGLFRLFPCDAIYALHNWPALPLGTYVARDGAMLAGLGQFEIVISGRGCHGAMPHEGTDCLLAACQLVSTLQCIVSRSIDPRRAAVVSATQIHAGDTWNVIPESAVIRGTTRWFEDDVGNILEARIAELARSTASGSGCDAQVCYKRRLPATVNDPIAAGFVRSVASSSPLHLTLVDAAPSTGSEDFAFMLDAVPGCYLLLGAARPTENQNLHSPRYDFNDESLPLGVALWVSLVRKGLSCT